MDPFSIIEEAPEQRLHDKYEQLTAAPSADHDIQYQAALRARFPELSLTVVPGNSCNLLRFAAAGHAQAELDETADPVFRWRGWVPSYGRGTSAGIGQSIFFAKYHYKWNNEDFIIYIVSGLQYVLKEPAKGESVKTPSKITDSLIAACGTWQVSDKDIIYVYDGYWRADKALFEQVAKAKWENVILDESMKKDLTSVSNKFFDNEEIYKSLGVPWKRGLIFYGPAGNGKTISIKALMKTLRDRSPSVPSLYVKSAPYTYNIQQIFQFARLTSPCLLVFEDIETIIKPDTRSYFLNEVDGLSNNDGILMVASTNFIEQLDPGLTKRPSRFDRKYLFPLPNEHERTLYAEFWRHRLQKNESKRLHVDFPERLCPAMAKVTDEFSFAYMQEAFVASLLSIARDAIDDPDDSAFLSTTATFRPSIQRSAASQALYNNLRPRAAPSSSSSQKDEFADLDEYKLWRVFREQVRILRNDMDHATLNELQQTWRVPTLSSPTNYAPPLPARPQPVPEKSGSAFSPTTSDGHSSKQTAIDDFLRRQAPPPLPQLHHPSARFAAADRDAITLATDLERCDLLSTPPSYHSFASHNISPSTVLGHHQQHHQSHLPSPVGGAAEVTTVGPAGYKTNVVNPASMQLLPSGAAIITNAFRAINSNDGVGGPTGPF